MTKLLRYVIEYLISSFMSKEGDWEGKLWEFIKNHFYEYEEKEKVKHKLVTEGYVKLIDEIWVFVDMETGVHIGVIQTLDIWAEVPLDIVNEYEAILTKCLW